MHIQYNVRWQQPMQEVGNRIHSCMYGMCRCGTLSGSVLRRRHQRCFGGSVADATNNGVAVHGASAWRSIACACAWTLCITSLQYSAAPCTRRRAVAARSVGWRLVNLGQRVEYVFLPRGPARPCARSMR